MLFGIAVGVSIGVGVIAVRVAKQPDEFQIQRSAVLAAPPEVVFGLVNDFHHWKDWSPWAQLDPTMRVTYEGSASGVGASYSWQGNKKVGSGKMDITASEPARRVGLALHFYAPMQAENFGDFRFEPAPEGTRVSWTMTGKNKLMGKVFAFFVDVDKMVGKDFEKGLAALGELAKKGG